MTRKRKQGDPRRAVGYVRVSTDDQSGGVDTQRHALETYAASRGLEIVSWHVDEISGATPLDKRPGLLAALGALDEHRAGVLLAVRRDRYARDPVVMMALEREIQRHGATLATIDGVSEGRDPGSELLRHMVDGISRFERRLISARTAAGMARLKAAGRSTGTAPIGTQKDGKAIIPGDEAPAVARALELAATGHGKREIAALLQAEGYRPRGQRWHPTTVQRLLARYRGHAPVPQCPKAPEGARDGGGGLSQST